MLWTKRHYDEGVSDIWLISERQRRRCRHWLGSGETADSSLDRGRHCQLLHPSPEEKTHGELRSSKSALPGSPFNANAEVTSLKSHCTLSASTDNASKEVTSHSDVSANLSNRSSVTTADMAASNIDFATSQFSPVVSSGKSLHVHKTRSKKMRSQSQNPDANAETDRRKSPWCGRLRQRRGAPKPSCSSDGEPQRVMKRGGKKTLGNTRQPTPKNYMDKPRRNRPVASDGPSSQAISAGKGRRSKRLQRSL